MPDGHTCLTDIHASEMQSDGMDIQYMYAWSLTACYLQYMYSTRSYTCHYWMHGFS